jgi:DNA-binding winged helix-turn-helix (wHTH) protein
MFAENFMIGKYKVSTKTRTIQIEDELIQLQPKVMDLLSYLAKNANKVISRDELIEHVWKGLVVSDDAIHRTVSILRSVLKDNPKAPAYLETIPKTGYRIIAKVSYESSTTQKVTTKSNIKLTIIAVVFSICVIGLLIFLIYTKQPQSISIPKFRYLTNHNGLEYAPQFSPVENEILYSQYLKGWEGAFTINSKIGSTPAKLNIDANNIDSIWSPSGQAIYSHLATSDNCKIMKHFLSGLPSQAIGDCITKSRGMFFYMDVSKDEKYLIVSERDSNTPRKLYQIDIDSGDRKPFFYSNEGIGDYSPKYSPNNQWLAFTRGYNSNSRELMLVPAIGGSPKQLTFDDAAIQDIVWTSANNIVFISTRKSGASGLWHIKTDGSEPTWLNMTIDGIDRFDISKEDQYLAYQNWYQPFNIYKIQLDDLFNGVEKSILITDSKKENTFPSLSPDGKYLAYVSNQTGEFDLWISDYNGENARLLVENILKYSAPEWSPDSKKISFTLLSEGQGDVCITNLKGQYYCISNSKDDELFSTWSNDGSSVYYTTMIAGEPPEYKSYKYNLSSREITRPIITNAINIKESEQPNIIYYNEAVSSNIYKLNIQSQQKELLIDDFYDVYYKSWHLAKSGIYYHSKNKEIKHYDFTKKVSTLLIPTIKIGGYNTTSGIFVDQQEKNIYFSLSPLTLNGDIGIVENFSELLPQ